ncbi:Kelch repeat-containing protein [Bizionia sp. KMM 8389]
MKRSVKPPIFFLFLSFILPTIQTAIHAQNWVEIDESENYSARHECGFVQAGNKFLLFGGREDSQTVDIYDYTTNSWTRGASAPFEFNHFQAQSYQGLIWVIGAFKTNVPNPEQNADYIYMYNPALDQWIQGMEIPDSRKRGSAGLVIYNNQFYLVGGNINGHSGGYVSYFDSYNPNTGIWTALDNAPHARDHFQACVYQDKLFAIGGRLTGGPGGLFEPQVPEVDIYNFETHTWSTLSSNLNLPTPRAGLGVTLFDNEIFTLGGETTYNRPNNGQVASVESFNPETNTWTTRSDLNYPRHGFQPINSGNAIYVLAGSSGGVPIRNMEYYGSGTPSGTAHVSSVFSASTNQIEFEYDENSETIPLPVTLLNTDGTTGTYIDRIDISGMNYSLGNNYTNLLINANSNLTVTPIFTPTNTDTSYGTLTVTYNNNSTLIINLLGTLNPTLSLNNLEDSHNSLTVYPSPTTGKFAFNLAVSEIKIYNLTGVLVKSFLGEYKEKHMFSLSKLPSGIYIIRGKTSTNSVFTSKLIKQ